MTLADQLVAGFSDPVHDAQKAFPPMTRPENRQDCVRRSIACSAGNTCVEA